MFRRFICVFTFALIAIATYGQYSTVAQAAANKVFKDYRGTHQFIFKGTYLIISKEGVTETFSLYNATTTELKYRNSGTNGTISINAQAQTDGYGNLSISDDDLYINANTDKFWINTNLEKATKSLGDKAPNLASPKELRLKNTKHSVDAHLKYLRGLKSVFIDVELQNYYLNSCIHAGHLSKNDLRSINSSSTFTSYIEKNDGVRFYRGTGAELRNKEHLPDGVEFFPYKLPSLDMAESIAKSKKRFAYLKAIFSKTGSVEASILRFWVFKELGLPIQEYNSQLDFENFQKIYEQYRKEKFFCYGSSSILNDYSYPNVSFIEQSDYQTSIGPNHRIWKYYFGKYKSSLKLTQQIELYKQLLLQDISAYAKGCSSLVTSKKNTSPIVSLLTLEELRLKDSHLKGEPFSFYLSPKWNYSTSLISLKNRYELIKDFHSINEYLVLDLDSSFAGVKSYRNNLGLPFNRFMPNSVQMDIYGQLLDNINNGFVVYSSKTNKLISIAENSSFEELVIEYNKWIENGGYGSVYDKKHNDEPRVLKNKNLLYQQAILELRFNTNKKKLDRVEAYYASRLSSVNSARQVMDYFRNQINKKVLSEKQFNLLVDAVCNFESGIDSFLFEGSKYSSYHILKEKRKAVKPKEINDVYLKDNPNILDVEFNRDTTTASYTYQGDNLKILSMIERRLEKEFKSDWKIKKITKTTIIYIRKDKL